MEYAFYVAIAVLLLAGLLSSRQLNRRKLPANLSLATMPDSVPCDEPDDDFICLHLGSQGTLVKCGNVTVRAERTEESR